MNYGAMTGTSCADPPPPHRTSGKLHLRCPCCPYKPPNIDSVWCTTRNHWAWTSFDAASRWFAAHPVPDDAPQPRRRHVIATDPVPDGAPQPQPRHVIAVHPVPDGAPQTRPRLVKSCKYGPTCTAGCTDRIVYCHHYFKHGRCKFSDDCKYVHK